MVSMIVSNGNYTMCSMCSSDMCMFVCIDYCFMTIIFVIRIRGNPDLSIDTGQ